MFLIVSRQKKVNLVDIWSGDRKKLGTGSPVAEEPSSEIVALKEGFLDQIKGLVYEGERQLSASNNRRQ
jgi:hypothetical protein